MFGSKISGLVSKTLHPRRRQDPVPLNTPLAEAGNNFPGTNIKSSSNTTAYSTNNFPGTNPHTAEGFSNGNNNFTGLNPAFDRNNFPGMNPQPWSPRDLNDASPMYALLPGDETPNASENASLASDCRYYKKRGREEEYGNNFPGANPRRAHGGLWGFSRWPEEDGNNFPGTNPNSRR
ncbi:hypothetical protein HOO65_010542 [Ceratocystis lukuohia]|uniref:Uncharacterized protein n=1 Tax=Ceratocystis lukuohia TaxID=2019550 RepID=A0ABR4MSK8_9PEZI